MNNVRLPIHICMNTFPDFEDIFPMLGDKAKHTSLDCFYFSHLRQPGVLLHPKCPEGTPRRPKHLSENRFGTSHPGLQKSIRLDEQGSASPWPDWVTSSVKAWCCVSLPSEPSSQAETSCLLQKRLCSSRSNTTEKEHTKNPTQISSAFASNHLLFLRSLANTRKTILAFVNHSEQASTCPSAGFDNSNEMIIRKY